MDDNETGMTQRQFAFFMWTSLFNEQRGWDWSIKDNVSQRVKQLFNSYERHAILLEKEIQKHMNLDEVSDDSEVFSKCLELIRKQPDVRSKQELYAIMIEYLKEKENGAK